MILNLVCCCCSVLLRVFFYEYDWGMCVGWGHRQGWSAGIPAHLAHLAFCSTAPPSHSHHTRKRGCFVCGKAALPAPRTPSLFFKLRGPGEAAQCGGMNAAEFIHPPVKGHFLLLFLARIHQAWKARQFEPSRGLHSRSTKSIFSSPFGKKSFRQRCSRPGVLLSHVRSCPQKLRRVGGWRGRGLQGEWGRWGWGQGQQGSSNLLTGQQTAHRAGLV